MTRVIGAVRVFETQRPDCRDLGDVFARLCPMEMPGIAGKDEDRAGRISGDGVTIEPVAETDVEDAGHDRVNAVLRMPMRHQLRAKRRLHPNDVRSWFRRMAHDNSQLNAGRERSKRLPVDLLRKNRHESVFAELMRSAHDTSLSA